MTQTSPPSQPYHIAFSKNKELFLIGPHILSESDIEWKTNSRTILVALCLAVVLTTIDNINNWNDNPMHMLAKMCIIFATTALCIRYWTKKYRKNTLDDVELEIRHRDYENFCTRNNLNQEDILPLVKRTKAKQNTDLAQWFITYHQDIEKGETDEICKEQYLKVVSP